MNRTVVAHTPLSPDTLLFKNLQGHEALSSLFDLNIVFTSPDPTIETSELIGKSLTLEINVSKGVTRYLNGIVVEFGCLGDDVDERDHFLYQARVRPQFWYLSQNKDSRVFVDKTVLEITETILDGLDYKIDCTGTYRKWGYCTQYQESGFNFLSRLFEQEGLYYYFEHQNGSHTLVITDNTASHQPILTPMVQFHSNAFINPADEPHINQFNKKNILTTSKVTVQEYSYQNATVPMVSSDEVHSLGTIPTENYEFYGGFKEASEAKQYSKLRSEELQSRAQIIEASGTVLTIAPGCTTTLAKHPNSALNKEYLICSADYDLRESGYTSGDIKGQYRISFTSLPKDTQFRAPRITKKPQVVGVQSATVTGPAGEEVYTNEYGDIKIQFHWDRYGQNDENSSNWVRVSQGSAGVGFGSINTPRIGEEVIVDFINGDIDRPIAITRTYNSANGTPWGFPAAAKQSGIKSKSFNSPVANFNELMFNDTAGSELVNFQAQKDLTSLVKNDETRNVDHDRTTTIGNDETVTVVGHRKETVQKNETIDITQNRTETVGENETITINKNRSRTVVLNEEINVGKSQTVGIAVDQKTSVGANQELNVGSNRNKTIGGNEVTSIHQNKMHTTYIGSVENVGAAKMTNVGAAYSLNVVGGWLAAVGVTEAHKVGVTFSVSAGKTIELNGGKKVSISAGDKLSLQCGNSLIVLQKNGTISIIGNKIDIGGSKAVKIGGKKVDIN
ncbi:type VI secretion system Vgr family protein [Neisseria sp. Ec49-e6-T10]|uniref:type VI secretion system Vgr family protein n=1 Tax=Neisseria sp. Ec49-e6-T10 TaxID=3140744 RepID=UPI003EBF40D7